MKIPLPSRPACGSGKTGAARSSSARGLSCSVKSGNERNPYRMLNFLIRDCPGNGEEGGDDVRSAWPLCLGQHTCYNGRYRGLQYREMELIPKTGPSSDSSLKLDCLKLESLVNVDHHATLNTFSSLAHTARQGRKVGNARSSTLVGPRRGR